MKIILAQENFTVGDLKGNYGIIRDSFLKAASTDESKNEKSLIVFSELSLIGYPPNDLLLRRGFVDQQLHYLNEIKNLSRGHDTAIAVGAVTLNTSGQGKPLFNSVIVFKNGKELLRYHKQLLPTYNIFDENRYFESGSPDQNNIVMLQDQEGASCKLAFLICEDAWNDEVCDGDLIYSTNPLETTFSNTAKHPDCLITINASPSDIYKHRRRYRMYARISKKYNIPIAYVNQVGGNDELIFDGNSFVVSNSDENRWPNHSYSFGNAKVGCANSFVQHNYEFVLSEGKMGCPLNNINIDNSAENYIWNQLKLGLRDYFVKTGFEKAVIGLSGGVDSALVTALACEVLGPQNVTSITLPSKFSSEGSVSHSKLMQKKLGFTLHEIPIAEVVKVVENSFASEVKQEITGVANENIQARIRAIFIMAYSNQFNSLVLATGNKSEISVGYCTLYGDAIGGLSVIGDCYKTEVFNLCRFVNKKHDSEIIPNAIIDKPPSAELRADQVDTQSLPDYELLDAVLQLYLEHEFLSLEEKDELKKRISFLSINEIQDILRKVDLNEFKRKQFPPILRIHQRSFGFGRNLPLAQKFKTSIDTIL